MAVPQNGWFIMENQSINGWFRGTPIYGNLQIYNVFRSVTWWLGIMLTWHAGTHFGWGKNWPMSVKGAEVARFRDSSQPGVFCTWHVKKISSAVWARFETRNNRSITTRKGHGWVLGASKQTSSKHLQFVHRCFCKGIDLPSCFRGGCDGEGQQTRSPFKF